MKGLVDFADKLEGVLPEIEDEILAEKRTGESEEIPRGLDSLSLPVVAQVFQFLEANCPYKCDIVHDQIHSFEPVYKYAYDLFAKAQPGVIGLKDGTKVHFGFKKACSLSFADSKTEPILRGADFALAGARYFIDLALQDKPIPPDVTHIAFANLGGILCETFQYMHPELGSFPHLGDIIASRQWASTVFGRLATELQKVLRN